MYHIMCGQIKGISYGIVKHITTPKCGILITWTVVVTSCRASQHPWYLAITKQCGNQAIEACYNYAYITFTCMNDIIVINTLVLIPESCNNDDIILITDITRYLNRNLFDVCWCQSFTNFDINEIACGS